MTAKHFLTGGVLSPTLLFNHLYITFQHDGESSFNAGLTERLTERNIYKKKTKLESNASAWKETEGRI